MRVYAFLCAAALLPWGGAQETISFRWNPPDGVRWLEHTVGTRQRLRGEQVVRTEITETTAEVHVRRIASGYIVSTTPRAHVAMLNGRRIEPLVVRPVRQAALDLYLNPDGMATRVVGFQAVARELARMQSQLGGKVVFDMGDFEKRELEKWQAQHGYLVNQTVQAGETWKAFGRFHPTPEVTLPFQVATRFVGYASYAGHACVRIEIKYEPGPHASPKGAVVGEGERFVDPDTLMVYAEREERRAKLAPHVLSVDPATLLERREYAIMLLP